MKTFYVNGTILTMEEGNLYASYGITTVQDGMVGKPLFQLLKAAGKMGILKLDIVICCCFSCILL